MMVPRSSSSDNMSDDCSTNARKRFSVSRNACCVSRKPTDFGAFPRAGKRASGVLVTRAGLGLTPIGRELLRGHRNGTAVRGPKYCTANWAVLERKSDITFVYQDVSSTKAYPGAGIGRFLSVKLAVVRAPADSQVNSRRLIAPRRLFPLLSRILKRAMRVRVLLFGVLKDVFQRSEDSLELGSEATVADLLEHYRGLSPERAGIFHSVALAVNQEYANASRRLEEGDEVALLPPVSGGLEIPVRPESYKCEIVRERIPTKQILEGIKHAEDGAVVVFEGIVRNHTRNRKTLFLDYEAYEPMAISQLNALAEKVL